MALAVVAALAAAMALAHGAPQDQPAARPEKAKAPDVVPADKRCTDCHRETLGRKNVHMPVARNECAPCHEQEGKLHKFRPAAAPGEICTQCHEMKLEGKTHDPVAKNRCLDCHDPHSSAEPRLTKEPDLALCGKCHEQAKAARKKFVHGPFAVGACRMCHAPHSSTNEKLLKRPIADLCIGCHEKFLPEGGKAVSEHAPAKDKCGNCHSGHESDFRYMLVAEPPALCVGCHKEIGAKMKDSPVPHKALSQPGGCVVCHDAHASRNARLLKAESSDLCMTCHDRPYPQQEGARPLLDLAKLVHDSRSVHGPIREKDCSGCHEPHGSKTFRLLKKEYPAKFYAPFSEKNFALCFSCHPKELAEKKENTATGFRNGAASLHFLHVNRQKGRTCRACHETHASQLPHHLRETTPFGQWDVPIGFAETPTGGSCAPGCHTPKTYDRGK